MRVSPDASVRGLSAAATPFWHDIREGCAFTLRLTVIAAFHYGARPGTPPPELLPVPMPFRPAIGQQ